MDSVLDITPLTEDQITFILKELENNGESIAEDSPDSPKNVSRSVREMRKLVENDVLITVFPDPSSWDSTKNRNLRQKHVAYLAPEFLTLLDKYGEECHHYGVATIQEYDRIVDPLKSVKTNHLVDSSIDSLFAEYETKLIAAGCQVLTPKTDVLKNICVSLKKECVKQLDSSLSKYLSSVSTEAVAKDRTPTPCFPDFPEEMMKIALRTCGVTKKMTKKRASVVSSDTVSKKTKI
jgi:hypothetical protein